MYEEWVTKVEARERTGLSERTIERMIQDGKIKRAYRPFPGRKPLAVLDPDDVAKLEEQTLKPIAMQTAAPTLPAVNPSQPDMTALSAFLQPRLKINEKLYLTVDEAAEYAGLPKAHIRKQIKQGVIHAVKLSGWRIKRKDLENYAVAGAS
jgi:excisionase family DNA binding protein